ncbi:MAG: PRC-barrel domain-containing protein [Methanobacteriaceae archaeon]|nr:PRC-barrel domain-containing protein [Methanobacteriaceae archaeon]
MRISKELIGKEVLNSDVSLAGKVVDVDINFDNNNEISLIVSKKGIQESLNIKKGELVIPLDLVERMGEKIILKSNLEDGNTDLKSDDDDLDFEKFEDEINELKARLY